MLLPVCQAETAVASKSATINFSDIAANEPPPPGHSPRRVRATRRAPLRSLRENPAAAEIAAAPPQATAPAPFAFTGFPASLDSLTADPPDCAGAVGPQHVVTTLNDVVQIQRRNGTVLSHVRPETFWAPLAPFAVLTDPRVAYDPVADRWVTVIIADPDTKGSALFVAASKTADPTGSWFLQRFDGGGIVPGTLTDFYSADYPTLGFNKNWVVVTLNIYQTTSKVDGMFAQSNIYVFNKAKLYAATSTPPAVFKDQTVFFGFAPAVDYDNTSDTLYLVGVDSEFRNAQSLRIGAVQGPVGAETYARKPQVFATVPWEQVSFGYVSQLGGDSFIDGGDDRMQNCVLRQKSLWCAHTIFPVRAQRSAVQWFQIDTTTFQIRQAGRLDDPTGGNSYAYPSIAVNKNGDLLIGFSRFSARQYASSGYVLHLAGDPPNTLREETVFKQGEAHHNGFRWGDFSTSLVDPADDTGFWTIQEYAASPTTELRPQDRWGTWWAQIIPLPATAAPCVYSLAQTAQSVLGLGGNGSIVVTTAAICPWMAASNVGWIAVQDGSPGAGNGTVHITVAPNSSTTARRTGTLTVAGQSFTVTQEPALGQPDLVVSAVTAPTSALIGGQIQVSATVRNLGGLKSNPFRVAFYLSASPAPGPVPADAVFCAVDKGLDPFATTSCAATVTVSLSMAPGVLYLAAVADDQSLIVEPDRSNNFRVADSGPITVAFDPVRPTIAAAGVVHAATLRGGAVSPGLIVVVSGVNVGPPDLAAGAPDASGKLSTTVSDTQLLFDQAPAPLLYARQDQLKAIVPYAVSGKQTTQMQVSYKGVLSNVVTLPVTDVVPGLFTISGSTGQAAAMNEDGTDNSTDNPAASGSVVTFLGTGEGQTDPPGVDGQAAGDVPPVPLGPVSVMIGGQQAEFVSAGGVTGKPAGLLQISARLPDGVTGDAVAVTLSVAGVPGQDGVTIAVK